MTLLRFFRKRTSPGAARVGMFGILCSGNLGNDGSLEAVVTDLRARYPDVQLGFFCMGPEEASARYGASATSMQWYEAHAWSTRGLPSAVLKIVGKLLDPFRTFAWVRKYDVVIVPGMGVLETTTPVRPWAFPYSLFWLGVAARQFGTKVALISVGANVIRERVTRWLFAKGAQLADYRSYRDELSRDAVADMGVDVSADKVYPDLAFALPSPSPSRNPAGRVGVGLMAYRGGNEDRQHADELQRNYVETMKKFVHWLFDAGYDVRLFLGDVEDDEVRVEVLADALRYRPDKAASIGAPRATTLGELMEQMANVEIVVATRYHNVLCGLKLGKPTLSISYADKHDVLMSAMGMGEFCVPARSITLDDLIDRFTKLQAVRTERAEQLRERSRQARGELDRQFAVLDRTLFANRARSSP
ncbi:polysaccharide pyruvyl transferase family protein [Thermocrispum agreste]|jgi:polysaccharide pyruvyl transferase WcaK-like protein|uniref:polysaccharide pyruvyl transferase family protein n=1 Tax=Thermocrispum agreste TaxID=37925 RepID=UPI00040A4EED|nr:polysaccharide pyruvyl transferase family protein [Thermocrispum agreste]